jgi:sugar lactone lactonase YvrE
VIQPDGSLRDKQPYFWLHMTDIPNDSGAEDLAVDAHGNLYVATRMGVQVCDQNGRVRAILPLPTPCGAVRSVCFAASILTFCGSRMELRFSGGNSKCAAMLRGRGRLRC